MYRYELAHVDLLMEQFLFGYHLQIPNYERDIYLRVKVGKNGVCHFHYSLDGKKYQPVGEPFTARQGKWIGAKVGLFSTAPFGKDRGWVDADWFRIEK